MLDQDALRVFVSFTGEDLTAHADVCQDVVRRLQWIADDHRDWGAVGERSVDECKKRVDSCDILVVLVAHRYGWVPTKEQGGDDETSITRWEVRWARQRSIPVLPYVVKDEHPWPPEQMEGRGDRAVQQRLDAFKAELKDTVCGFFDAPASLEGPLALNLLEAARRIGTGRRHERTDPAGYRYRPIAIRFGKEVEGRFPIELADSDSGDMSEATCAIDPSTLMGELWSSPAVAQGSVRHGSSDLIPSRTDVMRVGEQLYRSLFSDLLGALDSSLEAVDRQQRKGVRFLIDTSESPALAELPWEFLYDPEKKDFLFSDDLRPVVRWQQTGEVSGTLGVKPPLRLLIAVADPKDHPELRVGDELANLGKQLAGLASDGLVEIHQVDCASLDRLQKALVEFKPHLLHFVGHGDFVDGVGAVVLEDDQSPGAAFRLTGDRLAVALRPHFSYLRLVFLNSCLGSRVSPVDPLGGVAQSLVRRGLPAAIAMQFPISDAAAVDLSREFYRYVADGRPIDAALTAARAFLFTRHDVEWGAPALHMQAPDGQLFDIESPAPAEPAPAAASTETAAPAAPSPVAASAGDEPGSDAASKPAAGFRLEMSERVAITFGRLLTALVVVIAAAGLAAAIFFWGRSGNPPVTGSETSSSGSPVAVAGPDQATRDAAVRDAESRLASLRQKASELRRRAELDGVADSPAIQQALSALERQIADVQSKIAAMKSASGEGWASAQASAQSALSSAESTASSLRAPPPRSPPRSPPRRPVRDAARAKAIRALAPMHAMGLVMGLDGEEYAGDYRTSTIQQVQEQLTSLGLYDGPVDGWLEDTTKRALARFQEQIGLIPSGIPTPRTRQALRGEDPFAEED